MEKKNKTNAFLNFSTPDEIKGTGDFDTAYIEYEIRECPKKVGDGPYDYIMDPIVITHERDICEYIQSQAGDVGIYAYMERAARGLVDIDDVSLTDDVVDMSNAPQTLMDAAELGQKAQANFAKLPDDLTKGLSMAEFLASVSPEDVIKYYANKAAGEKVEVKEEVK